MNYMTFFNQKQTPCNAVQLLNADQHSASFTLALERLPASIERLVLTLAIDGDGNLRQLNQGKVRLLQQGKECAEFAFLGTDLSKSAPYFYSRYIAIKLAGA